MNRQPKLRFSVLRAKSLKQYYVKRRSVRKNPKPFLVLLSLKQSILANVIYNNQVFTSTKLRLSTASFSRLSVKRTLLQHPSQHLPPLTLLYQTALNYRLPSRNWIYIYHQLVSVPKFSQQMRKCSIDTLIDKDRFKDVKARLQMAPSQIWLESASDLTVWSSIMHAARPFSLCKYGLLPWPQFSQDSQIRAEPSYYIT